MFHIGRTDTHRDFRWATRGATVHGWEWPADTSDRTAARRETRQNLKQVVRFEPHECEATVGWTVEAKSDYLDDVGQMDRMEA